MQRSQLFKMWAGAERAAFVRPLCRVERLTYDVPTPSAIVGIFEAVLWHPGLHWRPTLVEVLRPIRYFSMRTNEVTCIANRPFDVEDVRTQRNTVGLFDVEYVLSAYFELDETAQHNVPAFEAMFTRYLKRGQLHHTPYFGMLPFICDVMEAPESYQPIEKGIDRPLGPMLYGRNYKKSPPEPLMFDARLVNGAVHIPSYQSVVAAAQAQQ